MKIVTIKNLTQLFNILNIKLSIEHTLKELMKFVKKYNGSDWKNYIEENENTYNS